MLWWPKKVEASDSPDSSGQEVAVPMNRKCPAGPTRGWFLSQPLFFLRLCVVIAISFSVPHWVNFTLESLKKVSIPGSKNTISNNTEITDIQPKLPIGNYFSLSKLMIMHTPGEWSSTSKK